MLKVPVALRELKILQESVLCFFEKIEAVPVRKRCILTERWSKSILGTKIIRTDFNKISSDYF